MMLSYIRFPFWAGLWGAELHLRASPWVVCVLWVLFSAMNLFSCFPKEKRLDFLEFLQLFPINDNCDSTNMSFVRKKHCFKFTSRMAIEWRTSQKNIMKL
jgi:hypothetical protein